MRLTTEDIKKIARGFSRCSRNDDRSCAISAETLDVNLTALKDVIASASKAGMWRKGRVDLFSIFERRNREALRSDVLAWLLDPDESHGCQDQLLRQVLTRVGVKKSEPGRVSVVREHRLSPTRRVDIFVTMGRIWVAIENKIEAVEGNSNSETMQMRSLALAS